MNWAVVVEYMDRAQGPTMDFFAQNLPELNGGSRNFIWTATALCGDRRPVCGLVSCVLRYSSMAMGTISNTVMAWLLSFSLIRVTL